MIRNRVGLCGQDVGLRGAHRAIDCFYVHHARQHKGIGATLMARIEREARSRGNARLHADVSITAEPFFRRMGFRILRRVTKFYRNRTFRQTAMEKRLRRRRVTEPPRTRNWPRP